MDMWTDAQRRTLIEHQLRKDQISYCWNEEGNVCYLLDEEGKVVQEIAMHELRAGERFARSAINRGLNPKEAADEAAEWIRKANND